MFMFFIAKRAASIKMARHPSTPGESRFKSTRHLLPNNERMSPRNVGLHYISYGMVWYGMVVACEFVWYVCMVWYGTIPSSRISA